MKFSLPMIVGNLFQQAYTIVDSAIVGHYNGEAALLLYCALLLLHGLIRDALERRKRA